MPYGLGVVLSLSDAVFARRVGFDRDRAFYPTMLIVIGSYYVLFAAMSGSVQTVLLESMVMTVFSIAAVVGSTNQCDPCYPLAHFVSYRCRDYAQKRSS